MLGVAVVVEGSWLEKPLKSALLLFYFIFIYLGFVPIFKGGKLFLLLF